MHAKMHSGSGRGNYLWIGFDREFPQWGGNFMLPFPDDYNPPQTKEAAN
jgi:hypothetical protein